MNRAGLSAAEAVRRRAESGPNTLTETKGPSAARMLLGQLKSPLVLLLLGACAVSAALGEVPDAVAIATIVLLNAGVGFIQDFRAERAVQALRALTGPRATVRRDGGATLIAAADVVPGDLLMLEAGDIVAADASVLEASRLATNEAPLTGESAPVEKSAPRGDRVFMGTAVVMGTGLALVQGTGMRTELGKIAELLAAGEQPETPLQKRLKRLSRVLLIVCLAIVCVVAAVGFARGLGAFEVFLAAVALAVAAVPEGLPAIVTLALAFGVRRIAAQHVLVRRLAAVETLGCAGVICTDKTGTLTTGVMTVREVVGADARALVDCAAACCDAELPRDGRGGVGDPTELALLREAAGRGITRDDIERARPRVSEHPFDPERKRMSILRADGVLYVKGAVETVLPLCTSGTAGAMELAAQMAGRGLRVLAIATGAGEEEARLELRGLVGLADPPREGAAQAVAAALEAGIETVLITGDNALTARAVAKELGIVGEHQVHARATPADKLRIIEALRAEGRVVAMTGDGVNDAPALRSANVGICMGPTGTEVAREAADLILTDDNYASIVAAVREGRGIFDNIRKALVYLLAGNAGELMLMLGASLAGLPAPLLPLQLLWINLVTDGLPALALVMDRPDPDVMRRPPRDANEPILRAHEWLRIVLIGALEAGLTLSVYVWALGARDEAEARTLAFSVIVLAELLRSFASRSPTRLFWELGPWSNRVLLAVIGVSGLAQVALLVWPAARALFHLAAVGPRDLALAVALGFVPVSMLELAKLARRIFCAARRPKTQSVRV